MQDNLLQQGMELLIFGMGTVYLFLVVLIAVTMLMSKLVTRFFPDPVAPVTARQNKPKPVRADNDQLTAVITAAIHKHRARQK